MAVVIETTLGDITVDLYLDQRPVTCLNFLKLCKMKYYNYNLFHTIRSDFIAQTGDPTGVGSGGESIWGILEGPQKRFFSGEKMPKIRHTGAGLLSMVCTNDMMVGSQFFFTLAPDLDSLDGTHCVIGEVTEGHEVLTKLNEVICDESNRPYRDVRITHTVVLEDPFNDPPGLRAPSRSPSPSAERLKGGRIAPDEEIDEAQGKSVAEVQEMIEEKEAKARATILEIVGDLPDAEIAPPENVLFVCKLNPVTSDDDLEIIFSRFGKIVSCEVIRDKKTGNSLQYAFIEFENKKACEDAYFKMDNVLIDDRRIHVDFSQSVSKMRYLGKGRGVQYLNDEVIKNPEITKRNRDDRRDRNDDVSRKHNNDNRRLNKDSRPSRHDRDVEHRENREKNNKRKYKSRSRSPIRNKSRERDVKNGERRDHKKDESHRHRDSESYRRRTSPVRQDRNNSNYSPHRRNHSTSHREERRNHDRKHEKSIKSQEEESKRRSTKQKESDSLDRCEKNKKTKHNHNNVEPKTPSPIAHNKRDKNSKKKDRSKSDSKKNSSRRKHKKLTSSESDSSDSSSSSSDTSSSSESDSNKKNKVKRKKKKYSSSSSSDSSSTGSSSSSDTSSDSSSSSSDSEPCKKRTKKDNNKSKKNKRK